MEPAQKRTRMHSMELKGAGKAVPNTAGTHKVKPDGTLEQVTGTATRNPAPFEDLAGTEAAGQNDKRRGSAAAEAEADNKPPAPNKK